MQDWVLPIDGPENGGEEIKLGLQYPWWGGKGYVRWERVGCRWGRIHVWTVGKVEGGRLHTMTCNLSVRTQRNSDTARYSSTSQLRKYILIWLVYESNLQLRLAVYPLVIRLSPQKVTDKILSSGTPTRHSSATAVAKKNAWFSFTSSCSKYLDQKISRNYSTVMSGTTFTRRCIGGKIKTWMHVSHHR